MDYFLASVLTLMMLAFMSITLISFVTGAWKRSTMGRWTNNRDIVVYSIIVQWFVAAFIIAWAWVSVV